MGKKGLPKNLSILPMMLQNFAIAKVALVYSQTHMYTKKGDISWKPLSRPLRA